MIVAMKCEVGPRISVEACESFGNDARSAGDHAEVRSVVCSEPERDCTCNIFTGTANQRAFRTHKNCKNCKNFGLPHLSHLSPAKRALISTYLHLSHFPAPCST